MVPSLSNPNPNTQCSVNTVATGSVVVSTTSSSSSTAQIVLSCKEPNTVVSCCSDSCSSGQLGEASCKNEVPNTESNKPEREIDETKHQEIEKMKIKKEEDGDEGVKKEEAENGGADSAAVRSEGDDGEKSGKEKEVIVLDDSLDDDFKQTKKRFRTPATTTKDGPVSYM